MIRVGLRSCLRIDLGKRFVLEIGVEGCQTEKRTVSDWHPPYPVMLQEAPWGFINI